MANAHSISTTEELQDQWRDIPGYEGLYQVSDFGYVKRIGGSQKRQYGYVLKRNRHPQGYRFVALSRHGVVRQFLLHQLVMLAFVGPRPDRMWINHKNGDKTDNRVSNLEYVTPSQNNTHAYETGLRRKLMGVRNPNAQLTDEDMAFIAIGVTYCGRAEVGGVKGLARSLGLPYSTVYEAIRRIGSERNG